MRLGLSPPEGTGSQVDDLEAPVHLQEQPESTEQLWSASLEQLLLELPDLVLELQVLFTHDELHLF